MIYDFEYFLMSLDLCLLLLSKLVSCQDNKSNSDFYHVLCCYISNEIILISCSFPSNLNRNWRCCLLWELMERWAKSWRSTRWHVTPYIRSRRKSYRPSSASLVSSTHRTSETLKLVSELRSIVIVLSAAK